MGEGGSTDEGDRGSAHPSMDSVGVTSEDFIRSAIDEGIISPQIGDRLIAHLNELKIRPAETLEPRTPDPQLGKARSAALFTTGWVHTAERLGEVFRGQAREMEARLRRAAEGDNPVEIQATTDDIVRTLKRAADARRSPPQRQSEPSATATTKPESAPEQPDPPPETPAVRYVVRSERSTKESQTTPNRVAEPRPAERRKESAKKRERGARKSRTPGPVAAMSTSLRRVWKTTTTDFAANTLTYIGVLLAVVVIVVFFAFGYFGDVVREPNLRPPVFVAVPAFFLGMAWVLRSRTGLPAAATAVGMLGALTVPVMLAALFRDWAPFPPDLHGSDRYWGYALVGVISAFVYFYLVTREQIYAYLVAPVLWAAAGALGLYWHDGMSGPQLFTVLAAIIVSFVIASRYRTGRVGKLLAVPTVRVGAVAAPFVFVVSLVFAYDDAVRSGVVVPGILEMAQPGAVAAALLAMVLALASSMDFAWQKLGPRTRSSLRVSLRILAYVAAGIALVLALAFDVTPGWIGAALVAYGIAVWMVDRVVHGTGSVALWIARGSILVGVVMATIDPLSAVIVWSIVLVVFMGRAVVPAVRSRTSVLLRVPTSPASWLAELWAPAFVVVGAGAVRLVEIEAVPWVLLAAAGLSVATRWSPRPLRALSAFAGIPAIVFALASLGYATWLYLGFTPRSDTEAGALAVGLAVVAGLVWVSWVWRAPAVVGLCVVGASLVMTGAFEPDAAEMVMAQTVALIAPGLVVFVVSYVPKWRLWAYPNGLLGHLCLYGAVAVGLRTEDAAIVALAALVATHAAEAVDVQRGASPFIATAAGLAGSGRAWVEAAPGAIAAIALLPLVIVAGRHVPWFPDERARWSLLLVLLAWAYTAAAAWLRRPDRWLFVVLAAVSTASAVAVAFPSLPASLVTVISAALVTFALAVVLHRPGISTLSWIMGLVGVVLVAAQFGVDQADLYRPLYWGALSLVIGGAGFNVARHRGHAITDRWLVPPVIVGLVGLPVSLAFCIAADSWIWLLAIGAAGTITLLGWSVGTGGVAIAVAVYVGIAYADVLSFKVNIFSEQPIYWMLFSATLVLGSGVLPGRTRWRLLHDASPGALVAGLASALMAVALAQQTDSDALVMAISSVLLGVVWLLRSNVQWLHAGIAVLIGASAIAGGGWVPAGLGVAALIVTVLAELRGHDSGGVVYPWVGGVLWGLAYVFFVGWVGWSAVLVTVVTIVVGAVLSGGALAVWLSGWTRAWSERWLWPAVGVGQAALVGAAVHAGETLGRSDALVVLAVVIAIEALLVGTYATVRLDLVASWVATGLTVLACGLFAGAVLGDPVDLVRVLGPVGAVLLGVWAGVVIAGGADRIVLWRWPVFVLGQGALIAASVAATVAYGDTTASGVLAAIAGWEALVFTLAATTTTTPAFAYLAAGFVLGSYAALVGWTGIEGDRFLMAWTALTLVGLAAATTVGRLRRSARVGMWVWPINTASVVAGFVTIVLGAFVASPGAVSLTAAVVIAALGVHLLVNRSDFESFVPVDVTAATAFVVSGAIATMQLDSQAPWTFAALAAMAAGAAIAAPIGSRLEGSRATGAIILVVGYSIVPLMIAGAFWGPLSSEVAYLLIISGGAMAAYGVASGRLIAFEGAVVIWSSSMLILLNNSFEVELHAIVVLVSVVLLAVLDVERYRHRRNGQSQPESLRVVEWFAMIIPLLLAASQMFDALAYGLVLAAEGSVLIVWGGLTRVRRRAIVGLVAVTTALVLSALIPFLDDVRRGLTGGTWLIIGAVGAVVMIGAGSLIERQRTHIGERLAHWEEILEGWE
jgi:hypothetical protein